MSKYEGDGTIIRSGYCFIKINLLVHWFTFAFLASSTFAYQPSTVPTIALSMIPSVSPTEIPSASTVPSSSPTEIPSVVPSSSPTEIPSVVPSSSPTHTVTSEVYKFIQRVERPPPAPDDEESWTFSEVDDGAENTSEIDKFQRIVEDLTPFYSPSSTTLVSTKCELLRQTEYTVSLEDSFRNRRRLRNIQHSPIHRKMQVSSEYWLELEYQIVYEANVSESFDFSAYKDSFLSYMNINSNTTFRQALIDETLIVNKINAPVPK